MQLVYQFNIKENDTIAEMCRASNDIYNQANFLVKKEFNETRKFLGFYHLDKMMKVTPNLDGEINYYRLKAQTTQQILKLLEKNWKSFFRSIKDWKKNPHKYKGMPKPPNFRKSGDKYLIIYTNQNAKIKDGFLKLSKQLSIQIPEYVGKDFSKFNQVRILPKNKGYRIEIIYTQEVQNNDLDYNKYASIDMGLDNLVALVSNTQPILFSGKILKSFNQWYNKRKAKLSSVKDKMKYKGYTKQLYKLEEDRENFTKDYLHKVSKQIITHCIKNDIGNLVIGKNSNWKDSINLGKRTNQKFVQIPHAKLIAYLRYKCELVGINLIEHEESYTSKCDALALEEVKKHDDYLGKRVKRGLFQSSVGKLINADVNGALNILRKVVGDSRYVLEIINSGLLLNPIKIRNVFSNSL
jgi:putative transposase